MQADGELIFPSKIDWWVPAILVVAILGAPVSIFLTPRTKPILPSTMWTLATSMIVPVGFVVWLLKTTRYVLSGPDLVVTGGPIRIVIPVDAITRVARSSSWASGATLSMYRLSVEYSGGKEVVISPADRRGFVRAIVARVPNVVLEDLDEYR